MEVKKPFMSKTLWGNLILALGALFGARFEPVAEVITVDNVALVFSVVNMVLRSVTKDKLSFS